MFSKKPIETAIIPPPILRREQIVEDFKPVKLESDDTNRDVLIAAARAYDETQRKIEDLEGQLHKAIAGLEAKNAMIDELRLLLETERNNNTMFRSEMEEARQDAARIAAGLANCHAILEQLSLPPPQRRSRKNGRTEAVPAIMVGDAQGGGAAAPEQAAVE
jgi:hypothetical protein